MPPAGIAYGLLSALAYGVGDFVGASAARRAGVLVVVAGSQLVGLVAVLAALLVVRPEAPGVDAIALGLLAGTAGAIGLAGLFGGMAIGSPPARAADSTPAAADGRVRAWPHRVMGRGPPTGVPSAHRPASRRRMECGEERQ